MSLEQNLDIIIASIPPLRRFVASISPSALDFDRRQFNTTTSRRPFMNSRSFRVTENGSDFYYLVPTKDIQVTKSLESQSRACRPSNSDIRSEFIVPEHGRVNGETAIESVREKAIEASKVDSDFVKLEQRDATSHSGLDAHDCFSNHDELWNN